MGDRHSFDLAGWHAALNRQAFDGGLASVCDAGAALEGGEALLRDALGAHGAQLGEVIWHSVVVDPRLEAVSDAHAAVMRHLAAHCGPGPAGGIRILEAGAYAHDSAHRVAGELGGQGVTTDISPNALRVGLRRAAGARGTAVACDYHDLPFETGYFDLVFIASAVHHTFDPGRVIGELLRVTRPGGLLHLQNEPVGRLCCLYQWRGNRTPGTPFEQALEEAGMLRTVSAPFGGTRDEELFGMIENDRIPLGIYERAFAAGGEVLALHLEPGAQLGPFERELLALPRDAALERRVGEAMLARLRGPAALFGERDVLLGLSVPRREEVWRLAYAVADALRALPAEDDPAHRPALARLFGAALTATIRRGGAPAPRPAALFRGAPPPLEDGVHVAPVAPGGSRLRPAAGTLPAVPDAPEAALDAVFPRADWLPHLEASGQRTLLNLRGRATIRLPRRDAPALMLLRFFAYAKERPYVLDFSCAGRTLCRNLVVLNESQMARFLVPAGDAPLEVTFLDTDGQAVEDHVSLRLGVAEMLPLSP